MKAKAKRRESMRQRLAQKRNHRAAEVGQRASPQKRPGPQPSRVPLAGELALIERFDGHAPLRNLLRDIAHERQDWAGIPMPLDWAKLVIEPTYPNAAALMDMGGKPPGEEADDDTPDPDIKKVRNRFWSWRWRSEIVVFEREDGKIDWGKIPGTHHMAFDLHTMGCIDAWGIEQEAAAVQLLGTLVRHRAFKTYMLTGMFLETSKRSGVSYLFRRLKPTLAIKGGRALCALCLHPIGYYEGTWSGAMCPTDDVVAHLMLARGDEAMFWRRANQIPAYLPNAGM